MKTLDAVIFKEQCLAVLDHLDAEGLVITKRGKPVARIVPYEQEFTGLIGSLRKMIEVRATSNDRGPGDVMSTGAQWDVDAEP